MWNTYTVWYQLFHGLWNCWEKQGNENISFKIKFAIVVENLTFVLGLLYFKESSKKVTILIKKKLYIIDDRHLSN